jgi:hypothetical protein
MQTYTPQTARTGYNILPSAKADSRIYSNPDGTFELELWRGDMANRPENIAVAFVNYGNTVIWADNEQSNIFLYQTEQFNTLNLVWDNSLGTLSVGAIFVVVNIDGTEYKYELIH